VSSVPELLRAVWARAWVRLLAALLALLGVLLLARVLQGVIVLAVVAFVLAYLFEPLLRWLSRHRVPRGLGVLLIVLTLTVLAGLLVWAGAAQLAGLLGDLPKFGTQLADLATHLLERLRGVPGLQDAPERLSRALNAQVSALGRNAMPLVQRLLGSGSALIGGATSVVGWVGQAAFAITLATYFMLDYPKLGPSVLRLLPVHWQGNARRLSGDVADSFGGYLRGQLIIGAGAGLLVTLGLLALHVPNALGLGLLLAALNIVPYIGLVLAAIPALLLALPGGWVQVALVFALYFLTNQVIGNALAPYVLGRTNNLSPAAVLLSLLVGLTLFGLVGGLLAVPTATLLKHWLETYWLPSRAHGPQPPGPPEQPGGHGPA